MHIADGVLSTGVMVGTYALGIGAVGLSLKEAKEEDIPRIALMSGTFFAISLISIPVPPSSVHPLLVGLMGIILGRKSALAFMPALLLQALLFKHGGVTSLGANIILLAFAAYLSHYLFKYLPVKNTMVRGSIVGFLSVVMTVIILILVLYLSDPGFAQGDFSPVRILIVTHIPLMIVEAIVTGAVAVFLEKNNRQWLAVNQ